MTTPPSAPSAALPVPQPLWQPSPERIAQAKRPPFAKLFHSERFGPVIAIRDGEMDNFEFHISIRFRPTRPAHISMSSVLTPSKKLRERNPNTPSHELMAHKFANLDLPQVERCIEGYLKQVAKIATVPAITFS
jgi:hypothetical protein